MTTPETVEKIKTFLPKLVTKKRIQEIWKLSVDVEEVKEQLTSAFTEQAEAQSLNFYGIYQLNDKSIKYWDNGKLVEKSSYKKGELQKLLETCLNTRTARGVFLILKNNSVVLWTFDVAHFTKQLESFGEWIKEKSQENAFIANDQESELATLRVVTQGNYSKKLHFEDADQTTQVKLDIPCSQWTNQEKTKVIMPSHSVPLGVQPKKQSWGLCSKLVYCGNKKTAFASHVSIIEDSDWMKRAMALSGHEFERDETMTEQQIEKINSVYEELATRLKNDVSFNGDSKQAIVEVFS